MTRYAALLCTLSLLAAPRAVAQGGPANDGDSHAERLPLRQYFDALTEKKLMPAGGGSIGTLKDLVLRAEDLFLHERFDDASVLLYEAVESPHFADYDHLDEYRAAEFMLASSLHRLGALDTAARYLDRIIARGTGDPYQGPAVRRRTDVAMSRGDMSSAIETLGAAGAELTEDGRNELRYLRARAFYDAGDLSEAAGEFSTITRKSRFYASARYFQGTIAARDRKYTEAESHFCAVADEGDDDRHSFYVDRRYFQVKDLARLGLGRVAHEQGRSDDAFYYYFQVPQDSVRLPEALFEASYAMYEGGDHDTAVDLLDQLEAKFPRSAFVDEASVLRGYVSLARCDFDRADRLFAQFIAHFRPVLAQIDRLLANPARREVLYEQLRDGRGSDTRTHRTRKTILSLLEVDPSFHRLHADVTTLEAEAARAGRVHDTLDVIVARLEGSDRPRTAAVEPATEALDALKLEIDDASLALRALNEETDTLRRAGKHGSEVRAIEKQASGLAGRLEKLRDRYFDQRDRVMAGPEPDPGGGQLQGLMAKDLRFARALPRRAATLRRKLVAAANEQAMRSLQELRLRLSDWLHRARIGQIDAVMGSKRRIEIQIESLAAGRFPAELRDPLLVQGLLSDDEEYWPFEGEDWPDEYEERYGQGGAK